MIEFLQGSRCRIDEVQMLPTRYRHKEGGNLLRRLLVAIVSLALVIPAMQGCATILTGTTGTVTINSSPSNADVRIGGERKGKTPLVLELPKNKNYRLEISKDGFEPADAVITHSTNYWWLAADIPSAFVGGALASSPLADRSGYGLVLMGVWVAGSVLDVITGKMERLDQEQVSVNLVRSEQKPNSNLFVENENEDVDIGENIPEADHQNPEAVAVVIGISHYKKSGIPDVDYAVRGANIVEEYLEKSFGVDKRKIIFATDENASLSDFRKIFGEELENYITPGKSDVYIYYQGHGVPDPETNEAYFVPYDCDPSYAKSTGYSLEEFYSKVAALPARSVTVILDACFSGASASGALVKNISPLYMKVKTPVVTMNNGVVFTSSTGEQVSCWYPEKNASLFTYYFLKGLKGDADSNHDGTITNEEMQSYLDQNVPIEARYLSNREQTPQMMTKDPDKVLLKYK